MIVHVWKIVNGLAPNDINMEFKTHQRLGTKAVIPELNTKAQRSISTHYDNSFGVKAAKLWNLLPKELLLKRSQREDRLGTFQSIAWRVHQYVPGYSTNKRIRCSEQELASGMDS
jgi:hypothetical protein